MRKPGLFHSLRRHRLLLPVVALLFAGANWACDNGSGIGAATTEHPAASIDLDASALAVAVGSTGAYNSFDVVNPAFADKSTFSGDSYGRLIGVTVQWTSSDPSVVSLQTPNVVTGTASGCNDCHIRFYGSKVYVNALKAGTATITGVVVGAPTVDNRRVSASFTVTVTGVPSKVVASPRTVSITTAPSDSVQLSAYAFTADGTQLPGPVTWSCGDPSIANVGILQLGGTRCGDLTATGGVTPMESNIAMLHPVRTGSTYVVATYVYNLGPTSATQVVLTDTVRVVVTGSVARVVVTPSAANILVGANRQLTAQAFDAAGNVISGLPVTWASRNTSVIAVNATTGNVQGVASGAAPGQTQTATATATIGGVSGDALITVYRKPGNVIVTPNPNTLGIGQSVTLHAKLVDSDNTTQIPFSATTTTWSSDNGAVVRVTAVDDSTATATGLAVGTTEARAATASGTSGIADVTVRVGGAPTTISLFVTSGGTTRPVSTSGEITGVGGSLPFSAVVKDASGTVITDPVAWSSASSVIASVDAATGLVTGKSPGTTTITATSSLNPTIRTSAIVTVTAGGAGGAPTSITISPTNATIKDGQTQQFIATLRDASGTIVPIPAGGQIDFVVDDSNIAEPLNTTGLIMAYETGMTMVRALYRFNGAQTNLNAAATLTVIPK